MKRRPFLQTLWGAGLASTFASAQSATEKAPEKKLGWALVGLGSLSTHQIAPALLKTRNAKLTGLVSGSPDKTEKWSKQYGIDAAQIYSYERFDEIIKDGKIQYLENKQSYDFTSKVDGATTGREKELSVEIITENNPDYENTVYIYNQTMGSPLMRLVLPTNSIFIKRWKIHN